MINKLKNIYFISFFNVINLIVSIITNKIRRYNKNNKRLLIIFVNAIGDFVLFTSILEGIRNHFNNYEIVLFGFDRWQDLADNIPYLTYIPFNRNKLHKNPFYMFKVLLQLKNQDFSIAIYPSYSRTLLGDLLMKFCISEEKIAYDGDSNNIEEKDKLLNNNKIYTKLITKGINNHKEIEFYHHFAEELGIEKKYLGFPKIYIPKNIKEKAREIILKLKLNDSQFNDEYVIFAPGAASYKRIWDVEKFAEVLKHISKYKLKILIVGSSAEKKLAEKIKKLLPFELMDLSGKTTLTELAAIIEKASFYFGSDSGLLHIAIAMGIPTICILGGGHPFRFYPYGDLERHRVVYKKMPCYGCNWKCIYNETKCIKEITPEQVIKEIDYLIKKQIVA